MLEQAGYKWPIVSRRTRTSRGLSYPAVVAYRIPPYTNVSWPIISRRSGLSYPAVYERLVPTNIHRGLAREPTHIGATSCPLAPGQRSRPP